MTFRKPSKISLSLRLSSNFFTERKGISLFEGRELMVLAEPADCAASKVSSRAVTPSQPDLPNLTG